MFTLRTLDDGGGRRNPGTGQGTTSEPMNPAPTTTVRALRSSAAFASGADLTGSDGPVVGRNAHQIGPLQEQQALVRRRVTDPHPGVHLYAGRRNVVFLEHLVDRAQECAVGLDEHTLGRDTLRLDRDRFVPTRRTPIAQ